MSSAKPRKGLSGLRDVATLQTLTHNAKPRERHQLVSRFARLENERTRLEREREMWETRLKASEEKLAKVSQQIDALRPLLLEEPTKAPVAHHTRGHARPQASTEISGSTSPPSRTIAFGY